MSFVIIGSVFCAYVGFSVYGFGGQYRYFVDFTMSSEAFPSDDMPESPVRTLWSLKGSSFSKIIDIEPLFRIVMELL